MPDLLVTPKPEEKAEILVTPKPEGKGSILVTPKPEIKLEDLILTKQKGDDSSRIRPVNGRLPRNHQYAGQVYPVEKLPQDLQKKFPHSVPFTGSGFPDFTRYAIKKVKIEMTGKRGVDERLANQAAGYKEKPEGYTWHHHHDGETMMLVDRDLHRAIDHTGGVAKKNGD